MDTILASASAPEILPADTGGTSPPDKQAVLQRIKQLKQRRNPYIERWKAIRDYELPYLGEFEGEEGDYNKGKRTDLSTANGVAWLAGQAFSAGIMSGLTPPSRQWFKFGFSDAGISDIEAERVLDERQAIVEAALHRSNFYNTIHACYLELPFGQAPIGVFPSPQSGVRFQAYTIGTYYLDASAGGRVNAFARKVRMSAAQIAEQFGEGSLPRNVREAYDTSSRRYDPKFDVWWLVQENRRRRPDSPKNTDMPWESLYWVDGQDIADHGGFLYVGGCQEFPVLVGRYQVTGSDVYGKGPGWYAEGDSKMLQAMKKDLLTNAELSVKPPMIADAAAYQKGVNIYPGGVTLASAMGQGPGIVPAFQVNNNPSWLAQEIQRTEDAIKRIYSADLFLMLDSIETPQMTAREVMERQQEKLQQLGPVVERLQGEFLTPIIERVYNILERENLFPSLPDDVAERLSEADVKIEYISPLAQAQKMSGLVNIEQALAFVGSMAQLYPEALKMIDPLGTVKRYFDLLGAPAAMQRSEDEAMQLIQQEQEAMQQQEQAAQAIAAAQAAAPASQAAKNLTDAAKDGNPALQQVLGMNATGAPMV